MAGSRLEKLGTIFSRVNGLIKSGAMKIEDRPIWYDVYKAFPPESEPHYAKPAKSYKIPNIFYSEDIFRAEFHKKARNQLPPINLREPRKKQNATDIAIEMNIADQSISVEKVIEILNKNKVLPIYNTSLNKISPINNNDSTCKINANEINTPTTEVSSPSN
ncbi:Ribosomal protein S23/S25, mitochondrial [Cinara cedri]|uniref:Small ribosomal subunit protein mS23 n=1 Tax=Cinara cedri TaxID=506608 RepID=A0A5E4ND31_9HEMI|nr:Ribosomal protein S23/S25, mitochondrial [Cinara cedri]